MESQTKRRLYAYWLACALGWVVACKGPDDIDLLRIHDVEGSRLDTGSPLVIRGEGWPVGRVGTAEFVGTLHRPGAEPVPVAVSTPVRASSPDHLAVSAATNLWREFGGGGTFRGRIRVRFSAARGGRNIAGESQVVRVDIRSSTDAHLVEDLERRHAARRLASRLGVNLSEPTPGVDGLVVRELLEGSPLSRVGVHAGDLVTELNGVRLGSLGDFVAAPSASVAKVRWKPILGSRERESELPLRPSVSARERTELVAVALGLAFALFAILHAMFPASSRFESRQSAATASRTRPRLRRWLKAPLYASVISVCACVLALARNVTVWHLVVVCAVASATETKSVFDRMIRVASVAVALFAVTVVSGSIDLSSLATSQGRGPMSWLSVSNPFAFALFVCAGPSSFASIGRSEQTGDETSRGRRGIGRAFHLVQTAVWATVASVVFFNGFASLGPFVAHASFIQQNVVQTSIGGCCLAIASMKLKELVRGSAFSKVLFTAALVTLACFFAWHGTRPVAESERNIGVWTTCVLLAVVAACAIAALTRAFHSRVAHPVRYRTFL